jgi:alpha-beta hydrolase superfamily lysophospholipase
LYFSGFCLKNEQKLFEKYLIKNDFTVAGFSYGAIGALKYAIDTTNRIDTLQFFSPAYFKNKDEKYKRLQLIFFQKDKNKYCDNFLTNCGLDKTQKEKYFHQGDKEELKELLYFNWDEKELEKIVQKDIKIEIFLGKNDKIIDSKKALEFFRDFGEVYFIKNKNHIL